MKNVKKSRLAGIPAWALSLMTFFVSIGLFEVLEHIPFPASVGSTLGGLIIFIILLTTACFIICKTHPKSVWYTPLICNAFLIFVLIVGLSTGMDLTDNHDLLVTVSIGGCFVLSVIASVIGASIGRRKIEKANN